MDDLFGSSNEPTTTMSMPVIDSFSVDPAADFLAREEAELNKIEQNSYVTAELLNTPVEEPKQNVN
jgi:hypothetical protein